ncbi:hypothetical protein LOD99_13488 [Oopsacas minuta]|uniref:Uncharacterized protein n=1 Tax=Oopsacas minuta TaxID=111878 RepID=A0AAV7KLK0_9METZ|nr:hypothetical protein LOD99_13488 [Oopsacas minuta]
MSLFRVQTSSYPEKASAWHEALISDSMEPFQSGSLLNSDPNSSDPNGLTALHWLIIKTLINPKITRNMCIYKCIEVLIGEGFRIDSQCNSGFTSLCMAYLRNIQQLCDISSLKYVDKLANTHLSHQPTRPNHKVLMNVCDILLRHGATLRTNNSTFSPLSYTQLYYHIHPHPQDSLLANYQHNIELQELYKLSLLKALTPENNYRALLKTVVKHGISFPHQPANIELSLESIVRILIQIEECFKSETFSYIYNLPSYHCGGHDFEIVKSPKSQVLEVIGAINSFKTQLISNNSNKRLQKVQLSLSEGKFLFLTIFIAVWESFEGSYPNTSTLMHQLTQEFGVNSLIQKLILLKTEWSLSNVALTFSIQNILQNREEREEVYFAQIITLIKNKLWYKVVALMASQVNDRCVTLGQTPLHYAAGELDTNLIHFLLEDVGAYPYVVSSAGMNFYEVIPDRTHDCYLYDQITNIQTFVLYIYHFKNRVRPLKTLCAVIIARHYEQYGTFARGMDYFIRLHMPVYK